MRSLSQAWGMAVMVGLVMVGAAEAQQLRLATNDYIYVVNSGSGTVSGFVKGPAGTPVPLPNSPYPTGNAPVRMVVNAAKTCVWVSNAGDRSISVFRIDRFTGELTPIDGSPFPVSGPPGQLGLWRDDTVLYVQYPASPRIAGFTLDPDTCALTAELPGSPFFAPRVVVGFTIDTTRDVAFVGIFPRSPFDLENLLVFDIDLLTGALNDRGVRHDAGEGPSSLRVSADGQNLYVSDSQGAGGSAFEIFPDGSLDPLGFYPTYRLNGMSVVLNPADTCAFTANAEFGLPPFGSIMAHRRDIGNRGRLIPVRPSAFDTGPGAYSVVVDATGRFIFAALSRADEVAVHEINPATCALSQTFRRVPVGRFPVHIVRITLPMIPRPVPIEP